MKGNTSTKVAMVREKSGKKFFFKFRENEEKNDCSNSVFHVSGSLGTSFLAGHKGIMKICMGKAVAFQ